MRVGFPLRILVASAHCHGAVAQTNTYSKLFSSFTTQLRNDKLGSYDPRVAPPMNRDPAGPSQAGVDVDVEIDIFKLQRVDVAEGGLALKIWFRLLWTDERLAWDPAAYGGVTQTWYAAADVPNIELNEIWSPDLTVYNSAVTIGGSFDAEYARVEYDGRVSWSRPGTLELLCRYSDIVNFPLDHPECKFEVGGWAMDNGYQGIRSVNFTHDALSLSTTQPGYAKFSIVSTDADIISHEYEAFPDENWPVVIATIRLKRVNWFSWILITTLPTIFLTYIAMLVPFLPPECEERLGYGITLIVAIEVGKLVLVGVIPVAGEVLQNDLLTGVSVLICYISLFESCTVLYLHYHEERNLMPSWFVMAGKEIKKWFKDTMQKKAEALKDTLADGLDALGEIQGKRASTSDKKKAKKIQKLAELSEWDVLKANDPDDGALDEWDDSGAAILYRSFVQWTNGVESTQPWSGDLELIWAKHYRRMHGRTSKEFVEKMTVAEGDQLGDDELRRLLFFEKLFFDLGLCCMILNSHQRLPHPSPHS